MDPSTTAGTLQFAVPALAAYPQTHSLSFFVDLAAIDPIPRPAQNLCPLAFAHPAERTEKSPPRKPPLIDELFRFLHRALFSKSYSYVRFAQTKWDWFKPFFAIVLASRFGFELATFQISVNVPGHLPITTVQCNHQVLFSK